VGGEVAEAGDDGGGVLDEGRSLVETHISEVRRRPPGWVAVVAALSGAWVEASDGWGEKASRGIGWYSGCGLRG